MRHASLGLLLLIPLALATFAPAGHALWPAGDTPASGPASPGEGEECHQMAKKETYKIPPGKCAKDGKGNKITNTGQSTIEVSTKDDSFSDCKLGESGSAEFSGNDCKMTVSGGGAASFTATGNGNTFTSTMGANSGGGSVTVNGSGNTVTNVNNSTPPGNNNHSGTTYTSNQTGTAGNTLNLGGEKGNVSNGTWTVNP